MRAQQETHWGLDGMGWSSIIHPGSRKNCPAVDCIDAEATDRQEEKRIVECPPCQDSGDCAGGPCWLLDNQG